LRHHGAAHLDDDLLDVSEIACVVHTDFDEHGKSLCR
jgi:hypothetical protein